MKEYTNQLTSPLEIPCLRALGTLSCSILPAHTLLELNQFQKKTEDRLRNYNHFKHRMGTCLELGPPENLHVFHSFTCSKEENGDPSNMQQKHNIYWLHSMPSKFSGKLRMCALQALPATREACRCLYTLSELYMRSASKNSPIVGGAHISLERSRRKPLARLSWASRP